MPRRTWIGPPHPEDAVWGLFVDGAGEGLDGRPFGEQLVQRALLRIPPVHGAATTRQDGEKNGRIGIGVVCFVRNLEGGGRIPIVTE